MTCSTHSPFSGSCCVNTCSLSQRGQYNVQGHLLPRMKIRPAGLYLHGQQSPCRSISTSSSSSSSSKPPSTFVVSVSYRAVQSSSPAPLAVSLSLAILLWSSPARAGLMSGIKGLESVPGPELPPIDFLSKFNEENQKKYAEDDARIKSSPIMKELLEKSKRNKEKNRQEILDKYCIRGAEWGVGDCSTQGMTQEEKDTFISMLKKKAGQETD